MYNYIGSFQHRSVNSAFVDQEIYNLLMILFIVGINQIKKQKNEELANAWKNVVISKNVKIENQIEKQDNF